MPVISFWPILRNKFDGIGGGLLCNRLENPPQLLPVLEAPSSVTEPRFFLLYGDEFSFSFSAALKSESKREVVSIVDSKNNFIILD